MAHKRYNKYQKKFFVLKVGIITSLLLIGMLVGRAVAKYYSLQKQKGVAVASDFYFSSDILRNGLIFGEGNVPTSISQYVKTNGWSENGGSSSIRFQIQNYQNSLLYNSEGIDIHYDVYAMLKEEDNSGITYTLACGDESMPISSTQPVKVFANHTLIGGEKLFNDYVLTFDNSVKSQEVPKDVYIWVEPTYPTYLDVANYGLGSSFSVVKGSAGFEFNSGFHVALEPSDELLSDSDKQKINAQIGLVYNISTSGIYEGATSRDYVPVTISWNSNYVEMDKFSEFYQNVSADANGIKTIDINIATYSSNDIIFYRTENFSFSQITKVNTFLNLVQAWVKSSATVAEE